MDCPRLVQATLGRPVHHLPDLAGDEVARDGDHAVAAQLDHRLGVVVVARPHQEALGRAAQDRLDLVEVAARLLDADDVRYLGQAERGLGRHVERGARRHVVEDAWQRGRLGQRREVTDQALLRRLVVVRHRQHHRVHAGVDAGSHQRQRLVRCVRRRAAHQRHVGADGLAHGAPDRNLLLVGERGRLTRGAGDDEAVVAGGDERTGQLADGRIVDGAVVVEGRDHGCEHAADLVGHWNASPVAARRERPGGALVCPTVCLAGSTPRRSGWRWWPHPCADCRSRTRTRRHARPTDRRAVGPRTCGHRLRC